MRHNSLKSNYCVRRCTHKMTSWTVVQIKIKPLLAGSKPKRLSQNDGTR